MPNGEEKIYDEFRVDFTLTDSDRASLRKAVVDKFLAEKSGYWKDGVKHVTKYNYFVETLKDGRRIYLLRPTFLNKGIDFQVWVEKLDGETDKKPSHKNIFEDLKLKKKEKPSAYPKLLEAIDQVCNCQEPDEVIKKYDFDYTEGYSVELLLKILKWLFIEQDITYWNYDGRQMLRDAINEKV